MPVELFELEDIYESVPLSRLDDEVKSLVRETLSEQSKFFRDDMSVCILPTCHDATVVDDRVIVSMPLEVFASDGNTMLGRGSVTVEYLPLDGDVEIQRIAGGIEWLRV